MPTFQIYNVIPTLPAALEPLREMTFNLWWTWEPSARRLFRHLDPDLWNRTNHNPVRMLQLSRQARLEELAQDKNFLRELKQVHDSFRACVPLQKESEAIGNLRDRSVDAVLPYRGRDHIVTTTKKGREINGFIAPTKEIAACRSFSNALAICEEHEAVVRTQVNHEVLRHDW